MAQFGMTYIAGETPVHRCDARVKIVVLFAFSIALLAAPSWWSVGILAAAIAVVVGVAKLPLSVMNSSLVPVYVMAAFSLFFNVLYSPGLDGVLAGLLVAVRMVALIAASFVVCFTTSSSELLQAFRWLIAPLRHLHAPVDDIALTLALSVRFIPVVEDEFERIRMAQKARGADTAGSLKRTLEVWSSAFIALFVGLFRHADNLALAMDARCYGASPDRTTLSDSD